MRVIVLNDVQQSAIADVGFSITGATTLDGLCQILMTDDINEILATSAYFVNVISKDYREAGITPPRELVIESEDNVGRLNECLGDWHGVKVRYVYGTDDTLFVLTDENGVHPGDIVKSVMSILDAMNHYLPTDELLRHPLWDMYLMHTRG